MLHILQFPLVPIVVRLLSALYTDVKFALLGVLLLAGCNDRSDFDLSNTIDAGTFIVDAPEGWKLIRDVGYDSNVGRIVGPLGAIWFDQGLFSFGGLDILSPNDHTIYFEHTFIDGQPAIFHKEKTLPADQANNKVLLTAYIEGDDGVRNRLYVYDPSLLQEKLMVEIIRTHRFK